MTIKKSRELSVQGANADFLSAVDEGGRGLWML